MKQTDVVGWVRLIAHGAKRSSQLPHRFYDAGPGRWHTLLTQLIRTGTELGHLKVSDFDQAAEDLTALWMGSPSLRVKLGVAKPMTAKSILKKVEHGLSVFKRFYGSAKSAG